MNKNVHFKTESMMQMTRTYTGFTENNNVQKEQLKANFLVKNTTISKIKCTIEKFPKEKHTISKNTFL